MLNRKSLSFLYCFILLRIVATAQPAAENLAMSEARFLPLEKTIYYPLGENWKIPVKQIRYGPPNTVFCFNMHDNEGTSVQAARQVLELKGGTLLKLENKGQRVIRFRLRGKTYAFDPNRIFSRTGIEQSLRENGSVSAAAIEEVEKFGKRLLELIPDSITCIIALHNNTEGAYSIRSYLPGGERRRDAEEAQAAPNQDPDDIILTTDRTIYNRMVEAGYNCILQDNKNVKQDGSLSVYCGNSNRRYVNIETQHGRVLQYQEMLEKLLEAVGSLQLADSRGQIADGR